MQLNLPIGKKLFFSHLLAVILVSGSIGTYFYLNAHESLMENLRYRLCSSAGLVSRTLYSKDLEDIRGPEDTQKRAYKKYLNLLREQTKTNPDIEYIYIMRREDDRVGFVIDSDETEKQALPGRIYADTTPSLLEGFDKPSVDPKIYKDEWGAFMSGYWPIVNSHGQYLVGLDMRADDVYKKFKRLRTSGIISLFASIILALLFSRFLSRRLVGHIHLFASRCESIAAGHLDDKLNIRTGDEFEHLADAFNRMSFDLHESREWNRQVEQALRDANENLEAHVEDRTRALTESNLQLEQALAKVKQLRGLLPICSTCKKIRDDRGYWQQVEEYMMDHSEAQFSHGLCPECIEKLYPELSNLREDSPPDHAS